MWFEGHEVRSLIRLGGVFQHEALRNCLCPLEFPLNSNINAVYHLEKHPCELSIVKGRTG